jgi:putative membrane protein
MYNGNYFWGMDMLWWFVWIIMIFWIFALPYNIPGQRMRKDTPADILRKLFASGKITKEEYVERMRVLNIEINKP